MAGQLVPFPRRTERLTPANGPDDMVRYLIGLIADVEAGKITGFVIGCNGPETTFISTRGDLSRSDEVFMAEHIKHRALFGTGD